MPSSAAAGAGAAAALHVRHARLAPSRERVTRGISGRRPSPARLSLAAEGPSCLFVGPIDTASKEMLEALYQQARDAYYSGQPLIVDDMFDKVELKLRLYGSESVKKYPGVASDGSPRMQMLSGRSPFGSSTSVNDVLLIGLGYVIGYPVASASVKALKDLWKNDLVALKGVCPNCGEEVFAFVRAEKSYQCSQTAECHVCESSLVFRTKVEQPISEGGKRWVYGRVYLLPKTYSRTRK